MLPGMRLLASLLILSLWIAGLETGDSAYAQLERLRKHKDIPAAPIPDPPMVSIPEGDFLMGANGTDALEDEKPQHRVWLDWYQIDTYEVTTGQYAAFLVQEKVSPPWQWESVDPAQHHDRPVIGASWFDAEAYCRWRGARLPTEAEWEKAARGSDGRLFPWGHRTPTDEEANFGLGARFSYSQVLAPVQGYSSGRSRSWLHLMAGNVGEWVVYWYGANYYETSASKNPAGPERGTFRVVRGGSWSDLPKYLLTYGRSKLPPETRNSYTGFRCARTVLPLASP